MKSFPSAAAVPLVLEAVSTDISALGITPAATSVVLDIGSELPEITERKLEGLTILKDDEISISNDNDFGIGVVPNAASKVYSIRLS